MEQKFAKISVSTMDVSSLYCFKDKVGYSGDTQSESEAELFNKCY